MCAYEERIWEKERRPLRCTIAKNGLEATLQPKETMQNTVMMGEAREGRILGFTNGFLKDSMR